MTDIERALADIAEVRERLGHVQRFKGYSAIAAAASGVFAIIAGFVQLGILPAVRTVHDGHVYFAIWFLCCAASLLVNYGAIAHWYASDASARDRWQTATVGLSMVPAILLGAILSFALLRGHLYGLLPGVWYACYGAGLFASRTIVPRAVVPIAAAFFIAGCALLFASAQTALQWWVPAAGFGAGQLAIAFAIAHERSARG